MGFVAHYVSEENMDKSLRIQFDQVDRTTDPEDFVRYLDATRATDFFGEVKRRSYAWLDLHPGDHVCDIGCGTGDDVLALSAAFWRSGASRANSLTRSLSPSVQQRLGKRRTLEVEA